MKKRHARKRSGSLSKLIIPLILGVGLVAAILLVKQIQDIRQRADTGGELAYTYDEEVAAGLTNPAQKILEVNLLYTASGTPPLTITSVRKLNGYPRIEPADDDVYTIRLVTPAGETVYTSQFSVPRDLFDAPQLKQSNTAQTKRLQKLTTVPFSVTIPYRNEAKTLEILDANGTILTTRSVTSVKSVENKPKFSTVYADDFLKKKKQPRNRARVNSGDMNGYLDIAFIGDDYTAEQMDLFRTNAQTMIQHLLTYEPFTSRANQIKFHFIDNTADLYCHPDSVNPSLPICNADPTSHFHDFAGVYKYVNASGVDYDYVVVIVNTTAFGGSGGGFIVLSGNNGLTPPVFAHETGHVLGKLEDEYVRDDIVDGSTIRNCTPNKPEPQWAGIVPDDSYFSGCSLAGYYRSSYTSIMNAIMDTNYFYNPISIKWLNSRMDLFTMPPPIQDGTKVSLVSPLTTVKVKKTVTITASASSPEGIELVTFYVNGLQVCIDTQRPYSCQWKVPKKKKATYQLTVTAQSLSGETATTPSKTVTAK